MTTPMPAQQPAKRKKPWVLISGLVLLVAAIIVGIFALVNVAGPIMNLADQEVRNDSHAVELQQGDTTAVWSTNEFATCAVTGPTGELRDTSKSSQEISVNDETFHRVMSVEAQQDGSHTISCSAPFVVGDGFSSVGAVSVFLGGALCCLSVVLIAIGGTLWLLRRNR